MARLEPAAKCLEGTWCVQGRRAPTCTTGCGTRPVAEPFRRSREPRPAPWFPPALSVATASVHPRMEFESGRVLVGAKTGVLAYADGDIPAALRQVTAAGIVETTDLVERLYPGWSMESAEGEILGGHLPRRRTRLRRELPRRGRRLRPASAPVSACFTNGPPPRCRCPTRCRWSPYRLPRDRNGHAPEPASPVR